MNESINKNTYLSIIQLYKKYLMSTNIIYYKLVSKKIDYLSLKFVLK